MIKKYIAALVLILSTESFAHCPAHYKAEKVCFMLDENIIYIYDEKVKHEGPYKDLAGALESMKADGADLKFSRIARGIYKIDHKPVLNSVDLTLVDGKTKNAKRTNLKLKSE